MTKYIVTVSYVCEADSDLGAIFALNRSLYPLAESELEKFDAIKVEEVK
jgi:hypothetical protein